MGVQWAQSWVSNGHSPCGDAFRQLLAITRRDCRKFGQRLSGPKRLRRRLGKTCCQTRASARGPRSAIAAISMASLKPATIPSTQPSNRRCRLSRTDEKPNRCPSTPSGPTNDVIWSLNTNLVPPPPTA